MFKLKLEESHYEEQQKVPIIPSITPAVSSFGAALTRSKSVKSLRSKSFNYGRKSSKIEVQVKLLYFVKMLTFVYNTLLESNNFCIC